MKKRDATDFLHDLADAGDKAIEFVSGMSFAEFKKDEKTIYAAIRAIEIMGEAAKRIPAALKRKHSDIPWKEIAGMRDVLIHGYFGVDMKTLWRTLKEDIPAIKKPLGDIIRGLPKD